MHYKKHHFADRCNVCSEECVTKRWKERRKTMDEDDNKGAKTQGQRRVAGTLKVNTSAALRDEPYSAFRMDKRAERGRERESERESEGRDKTEERKGKEPKQQMCTRIRSDYNNRQKDRGSDCAITHKCTRITRKRERERERKRERERNSERFFVSLSLPFHHQIRAALRPAAVCTHHRTHPQQNSHLQSQKGRQRESGSEAIAK